MTKINHSSDKVAENMDGVYLDPEIAGWIMAHEESYRKAWVIDNIYVETLTDNLLTVLVARDGIITERWMMFSFLGKWEKEKSTVEGGLTGMPESDVIHAFGQYKLAYRRATNTMSKEVLYYKL